MCVFQWMTSMFLSEVLCSHRSIDSHTRMLWTSKNAPKIRKFKRRKKPIASPSLICLFLLSWWWEWRRQNDSNTFNASCDSHRKYSDLPSYWIYWPARRQLSTNNLAVRRVSTYLPHNFIIINFIFSSSIAPPDQKKKKQQPQIDPSSLLPSINV